MKPKKKRKKVLNWEGKLNEANLTAIWWYLHIKLDNKKLKITIEDLTQ
jgi:hypothetical protein